MKFYDQNNKVIETKEKPFISAEMKVKYLKLYRKYEADLKRFMDWTNKITAEQAEIERQNQIIEKQNAELPIETAPTPLIPIPEPELTDAEFVKLHKFKNFDIRPKDEPPLIWLYRDELNRELYQIIFQENSTTHKTIIDMINNPEHELWNKQDVEELDTICRNFRQRLL